jgi:hypothetical protein
MADAPPNRAVRNDLRRLKLRNVFSKRSVLDSQSRLVVTMTTHGSRIDTVYLAIESIARGTSRPHRLALWLDDPTLVVPARVKRLQKRGLEVRVVDAGLKVHTKYYPYTVSRDPHEFALVTSDDDILYPPEWLESLNSRHKSSPSSIICYRAHTIALSPDGIAPYATWSPCTTTEPSFLTFGTSVSGQLFPPEFLDYVRGVGDAFLHTAANNDDIWLHHLAVSSGTRVSQVTSHPQHFPFVPGTQSSGLYFSNFWGDANDRQIASTYTASDVKQLRAEATAR